MHEGVYRLNGVPASWRHTLLAACLAAGVSAVASHRAAAALWAFAAITPGFVEVCVPGQRRVRRSGFRVHRAGLLGPADVTTIDGIPVTTPTRTLIDLAAIVTRDVLEEALDDALRRKLTTIAHLRWRISKLGRRGRPGVGVLLRLLDDRGGRGVPQSVLETRFARLLRRSRLPEAVRQHPVRHGGRLIGIVDFAYPDIKLAVEADGYRWHSGRSGWEHDRARRNELTLLGWLVIHVTAADLKQRPKDTAERIREAYRRAAEFTQAQTAVETKGPRGTG